MRRLNCIECGEKWTLHSEDVANGFKMRKIEGIAYKPAVHGIAVNGEFSPIASLLCDTCGKEIKDGTKAVAVTMWRDDPIGFWEYEYFKMANFKTE